MVLQLHGLALHLQEIWLDQLRAPARIQPGAAECFLMAYSPPPSGRRACFATLRPPAAASARLGCGPGGGATALAARGGQGLSGSTV